MNKKDIEREKYENYIYISLKYNIFLCKYKISRLSVMQRVYFGTYNI